MASSMNDFKIMINSSPRSGSAWLQSNLMNAMFEIIKNKDQDFKENFLSRTHTPEMLLGMFPANILQTTIIRNPLDIIPSIITKTYGGLGSTVSLGINMPHEMKQIPEDDHFIDGQVKVAKKYLENTLKNFDNLHAFTFEDVTQNMQFVVDTFVKELGLSHIELNSNEILMTRAKNNIETFNYGHPGYSNAVPVEEKPEVYYRIKEKVEKSKSVASLTDLYQSVLYEIKFKKDKQDKKWNI